MEIFEFENGLKEVRNGITYKEMQVYSPATWGKNQTSTVGVKIDPYEMTIEVRHLLGAMPHFEYLFSTLLGDFDIRKLIVDYQEKDRIVNYKIWETTGISGRRDVFMTLAPEHGDFVITKTFKLCHISGYGKLNEGFGDENSTMYIGDFVELAVFLGLTENMDWVFLQQKSDVTYLSPKVSYNLKGYETTVSKLL